MGPQMLCLDRHRFSLVFQNIFQTKICAFLGKHLIQSLKLLRKYFEKPAKKNYNTIGIFLKQSIHVDMNYLSYLSLKIIPRTCAIMFVEIPCIKKTGFISRQLTFFKVI